MQKSRREGEIKKKKNIVDVKPEVCWPYKPHRDKRLTKMI
jgi:hypothetical protein